MAALRVLGRGGVFDCVAEQTNISEPVIQCFFHSFITHWSTVQFDHFVKWPTTAEEIQALVKDYACGGLDGGFCSSDVCHVCWDRCNVYLANAAKGKEGFTTIGFGIAVSHRRRILHSTGGFLGATNDKTIARHDSFMTALRTAGGQLDCARDFKYSLFDSSGRLVQHKGAYILVDNGYHKWAELMNPISHPNSIEEKRWSANLESFRKDVECTFGILKGRFRVLKTGIRLQSMASVVRVWKTCCALHNMLLEVCNKLIDIVISLHVAVHHFCIVRTFHAHR